MQKHTHRWGKLLSHWLDYYSLDKPDRLALYVMQGSMMTANRGRKKGDQIPFDKFLLKRQPPKRRNRRPTKDQLEWYSEMSMAVWSARLGFGMDGKPVKDGVPTKNIEDDDWLIPLQKSKH
jgi:hypothetical protein